MIALQIEFLSGRFHANPWDRGTNDGEVDWPPAPWRVLRAITAGWYRNGSPDREVYLALLDRLVEPPIYYLPRATAGHTRHYMPLGTLKGGKPETTLILDSFIALEHGREPIARAYAQWPHAELTSEQRALLERCCATVGYLGRAESWCAVQVVDDIANGDGLQLVDLASREADADGPTVRRLAAGPSLRGEGLLRALSETTAEMRKARHLMPGGTAWVEYRLPSDFLMVREQFERPERTQAVFGPMLLRFALERGQRSPRPPIKDAVVFGELMRAAAISRHSQRLGEPATRRLAGKGEDGARREGHDHPYFLACDLNGRGEVDVMDVWFPQGCTHAEYAAVTSVSMLCERVLYHDDFPLTFLGDIERTRSHAWTSVTPIVLERFPKRRGPGRSKVLDAPEEQVNEMVHRLTGHLAQVEIWQPGRGIERRNGGTIRVDAFRRARIRKPLPPLPVIGATLRFDEAVEGPLVLGKLAHFGLGQFRPCEL